jgi:hypothetical protein
MLGCARRSAHETKASPPRPLFPEYPPINDADPQVRSKRTFQVPTRLVVKRTPEGIEYSVETNSLETIEIEVGQKMVFGVKHQAFVVSGNHRKQSGVVLGGTTYTWTGYIDQKESGIPKPSEKYVIEIIFVIFETDIPSQHLWDPQSDKYKELWTRTLKSEEL